VARAISDGRAARGTFVCGSGAGVSVAASKVHGIRAATVSDTYTAHQSVEHDDLNVLCRGGSRDWIRARERTDARVSGRSFQRCLRVLVVNAGSSSLKLTLLDGADQVIARERA
jgi:hypothetical protein